ncbi:hypothetical protein GCM10017557_06790 [Streptomyces aurantiacus]|uniref:Uncharacterized protein n=1 Tax=Streptomyces aurantiacus TaxID=47760 RepID=A0A7G1NVU7_9ACTN|nr:hypothetical protein GCM10017557_06790 [Streptomyces aurantiacus]
MVILSEVSFRLTFPDSVGSAAGDPGAHPARASAPEVTVAVRAAHAVRDAVLRDAVLRP